MYVVINHLTLRRDALTEATVEAARGGMQIWSSMRARSRLAW